MMKTKQISSLKQAGKYMKRIVLISETNWVISKADIIDSATRYPTPQFEFTPHL
jgi:hypothetical protein